MADKDDFFVTFGSNASTWAKGLEAELSPARQSVQNLQNMLDKLKNDSGGSADALSRALGATLPKDVAPPPSTRGGGQTASQELGELAGQIETVVTALRTIPDEVKKLKQAVTQHRNGIEAVTNQPVQTTPRGDRGRFFGTAEDAIGSRLTRMLKNGIDVNIPDAVPSRLVPQMNIRSIGMDTIQKSQVDRIVKAIKQQTSDLQKALKNVKVTGGSGPTGGGGGGSAVADTAPLKNKSGKKPSTTKTKESVDAENALDARRSELLTLEKKIGSLNRIIAATGNDDVTSFQKQLRELKKQRTEKAKELAALERQDTEITRAQQKKARRGAAASERAEEEARQQEVRDRGLRAFNTLMDPKFSRDSVGKGPGLLQKKDLREIADFMGVAGTPVKYGKSTTNDALVDRLLNARAEYTKSYGTVAPDAFTGRIRKPDQISKKVIKLFNDLEQAVDLADDQIRAQALTALNTYTGGGRPSGIGKSRTEYGAAFFDDALPLSRGKGGTTADVDEARAILKRLPEINDYTAQNLRRKKFDPYDPELMGSIEGGGTRATAMRLLVKALRDETSRIDELSHEYAALASAIDKQNAFIERASNRLSRGEGRGTDEEEIEKANRRIAGRKADQAALLEGRYGGTFEELQERARRHTEHMASGGSLTKEQGAFLTDIRHAVNSANIENEYDKGFIDRAQARVDKGAGRQGDVDEIVRATSQMAENSKKYAEIERQYGEMFADPKYVKAREGRVGPRAEYEERRNASRSDRPGFETMQTYEAITHGIGQALVGFRNAIGSREVISNQPSLRYVERGEMKGRLQPRDPRDTQISEAEQRTLNSLLKQYERATRVVLTKMRKGEALDAEGMLEAVAFLEKSANNLANKLFDIDGVGPTVQELTGGIGETLGADRDPKVLADEEVRVAKIAETEALRTKKLKATAAEKLARAEYTEAQTKEALTAATKRERDIATRLAAATKKAQEGYNQLSDGQKAEYDAHVEYAATLDAQADQLRRQIAAQSNIRRVTHPDGKVELAPNELPPRATADQKRDAKATSDLIQEYASLKGQASAERSAAAKVGANVTTTPVETRKMTAKDREYIAAKQAEIAAIKESVATKKAELTAIRYTSLPSGQMPGALDAKPVTSMRGKNVEADVLGYPLGTTNALSATAEARRLRDEIGSTPQQTAVQKARKELPAAIGGVAGELVRLQKELATFNAQFDERGPKVRTDRVAGLYPGLVGDLEGEAKEAAEGVEFLAKSVVDLEKATVTARRAADREAKARYATKEGRLAYRGELEAERNRLRVDPISKTPTLYTQADIKKLESEIKAVGGPSPQQVGGKKRAISNAEKKGDLERVAALREQLSVMEAQVATKLDETKATRAMLEQAKKTRARLLEIKAEITKLHEMDEGIYKGDDAPAAAKTSSELNETNTRLIAEKKKEIAAAEANRRRLLAIRKLDAALGEGEKLDPKIVAERTRRQEKPWTKEQLRTMRRELRDLEGGGVGGGVGGPGGPGGPLGPSGSGRELDVLRRILARLNGIHATLKSNTVKSGSARDVERPLGTGTPTKYPSARELAAVKSKDDAERLAAIEEQRRRSQVYGTTQGGNLKQSIYQDAATEQVKNVKVTRDQYRAQLQLAEALNLVSQGSRDEAAELARLNRVGATNAEVAAQQVRLYNSVQRDLAPHDLPLTTRRGIAGTITGGSMGPGWNPREIVPIEKAAQAAVGFQDVGASAAEEFHTGFARVFPGKNFWSRVMNTTGTFIVRNFAAGAVFGMTAALQQVISQAIETESTFIRVSAALDSTNTDIGSLRGDLQNISTDYGVALNDVYSTAAGLTGLFRDTDELAGATRVVAQLQTISGGALNATEAMGVLSSTLSAFQARPGEELTSKLLPGGVEGMEHVADVLTLIQNRMSTNIEVTAEGVSSLAGLARQMQFSFEETAVFVAQIAKQTNQTGAAAGEQFSRISGALQTGRGRSAVVGAIGDPATAALADGNYGQVFKLLIGNWDSLSDSQQRNLGVALAGQRQLRAFTALMNNGAETLDTLARAEDASGDASERMEKLMKTLNKQIDVLTQNVTNLASNLIRSGLLNFLGLILKFTNATLGKVNDLLTAFNDLADSNPLLNWARKGISTLIGFAVAIKLVQAAVRGITQSMGALRGKGAADGLLGGASGGTTLFSSGGTAAARPGPPDRPGYGSYRRPNSGFLAPGARFLTDRTVGITSSATARTISAAGERLSKSTNVYSQRAATAFSRAGDGMGRAADALRTRLQTQSPTLAGRALERGAGSSNRAISGLSKTLHGLGQSGLGADAALIGATVAIGSWIQAVHRSRRIAEENEETYEQVYGSGRGQTKEEAEADRYVGPFTDFFKANTKSFTDENDGFLSDLDAMGNLLGQTIKERDEKVLAEILAAGTGFLSGDTSSSTKYSQERIQQSYGYTENAPDGNLQSYGTNRANDIMADAWAELNRTDNLVGVTGEDIRELQEEYSDRIAQEAAAINNSSRSDEEKQAALANLERVGQVIVDEMSSLAAIHDSALSKIALSSQQIQSLTDLMNTAVQFEPLGFGDQSDLAPIIADMRAEVGGTELGPKMNRLLDTITDPGSDEIEVFGANKKLLKEQIFQTYNSWQKYVDDGSEEQASAAYSTLQSLMSQYANSTETLITSMVENGQAMAEEAYALGQEGRGLRITEQTIRDAQRVFEAGMRRDKGFAKNLPDLDLSEYTPIAEDGSRQTLSEWKTRQYERILENESDAFSNSQVDRFRYDPRATVGLPEGISPQQGRSINAALDAGGLQAWNKNPGQVSQGQLEEINAFLGKKNPYSYDPDTNSYQSPLETSEQRFDVPNRADTQAEKKAARKQRKQMEAMFEFFVTQQILSATAELQLQIAGAVDQGTRDALQLKMDNLIATGTHNLDAGKGAFGISPDIASIFGPKWADAQKLLDVDLQATSSRRAYEEGQVQAADDAKADAAEARANAAALRQARLGVAAAWADARGDAVAAARVQVQMAKASIAAAQAELAAASTSSETAQARIAILDAQASLIAANAAVQSAQTDLVQSQYEVSIALAEAAGNTVLAAQRSLGAARAALRAAMKKSGGRATAEVNASRAEVIRAEAAARDAKLQDQLDTIDFNLEMDRITASSAIAALKNILKTNELTKEQRRSLMLQIKGMEEEMASSQWNFGNIKLPTGYQMRRYGKELMQASGQDGLDGGRNRRRRRIDPGGEVPSNFPQGPSSSSVNNDNRNVTVFVSTGMDLAKVRRVIEDVTGKSARTTTTSPRRRV